MESNSDQKFQREIALKYLKSDISIIPIRWKHKRANFKMLRKVMNCSSFYIATISPYLQRLPSKQEILVWFEQKTNCGIVTGYKGIVTIDFDEESYFEIWKKLYPDVFKNTPIQKTLRGYHVFIKISSQNRISTSKALFQGKIIGDVVGYRGYTTVYPSIHPSGYAYKWLKSHEPWHQKIYSIQGLEDVGISQVQKKTLCWVIAFWIKAILTKSPKESIYLIKEMIKDHLTRL